MTNSPVSEYPGPFCPLSMSDLVITKKVKKQRFPSKGRDIRERARAHSRANRPLKAHLFSNSSVLAMQTEVLQLGRQWHEPPSSPDLQPVTCADVFHDIFLI